MKKLVLSLAVLASVAFVSCGSKEAKNDSDSVVATEDSVAPAEDSVVNVEAPADSTVNAEEAK